MKQVELMINEEVIEVMARKRKKKKGKTNHENK